MTQNPPQSLLVLLGLLSLLKANAKARKAKAS
jgi:hypothetical protein